MNDDVKTPIESEEYTYDEVSLARVESLEHRIAELTRNEASTDGALSAAKAALSGCEVRLDGARAHADEATARFADVRTAAAGVLGACRTGYAAHQRANGIEDTVGALLQAAHETAEQALAAAAAVDELAAETQSYGKNHYLPAALVDGVNQAETSAKALVAAAIEAIQTAMAACVAASVARVAAEAVVNQGDEVWAQLDAQHQAQEVRGISHLHLGSGAAQGWQPLAQAVWLSRYPGGLLNLYADIQDLVRAEELEMTAAVAQTRLEVSLLEQRLGREKAALRSAQLAMDGARVVLGTQF